MNYQEATALVATMCSDLDLFRRLISAGLKAELFIGVTGEDPDEAKIFDFSKEWYLRDGTVPERKILEDEFSQFFTNDELPIPTETKVQPEYVVSILKNNAVMIRMAEITRDTSQRISADDVDQVAELTTTLQDVSNLYVTVSGSNHIRLFETALPETIGGIMERADNPDEFHKGLAKFPYEPMNDVFYGLQPADLAVFFGYTGDMKSWTLEKATLDNAMAGKRVAHFTFENRIKMSVERMLGFLTNIPTTRISKGILQPFERTLIEECRDKYSSLPILFDESPSLDGRTVEAIFTKARMYEAELVVIDQASWVESPTKYKSLWENQHTTARMIKEYASLMDIPVILAVQANRKSQGSKTGTRLDHIAGSDETTKAASFVTSLDFDPATDQLICDVRKARGDKTNWRFTISVNLDTETSFVTNQTGLSIPTT